MSEPVLHKYFDFGDRALANVTLPSGERVLLTIVPNGFAVHRLHLFGMIPGRCLFGANDPASKQMATCSRATRGMLPPLPRAKKHRTIGDARFSMRHADLKASENKPTRPVER